MQAAEFCLPVVDIILALPQLEIDDVDGIQLAYPVVVIPKVDVLRDGLGDSVEHPVEIVQFMVILHLNDEQTALTVLRQHVRTVELIVGVFLIAFAFQKTDNTHILTQQSGQETLQHDVVALISEQAFHRPVKAYQIILHIIYHDMG